MPSGSKLLGADVGTLWTLIRGDERARCALVSWPDHWELRILIGGASERKQDCREMTDAFAISQQWMREFVAQGWRVLLPGTALSRAS